MSGIRRVKRKSGYLSLGSYMFLFQLRLRVLCSITSWRQTGREGLEGEDFEDNEGGISLLC